MILLIHHNGQQVKKIFKEQEQITVDTKNVVNVFWKLAECYPSEIIIWIEEAQESNLNLENFSETFHHDLIMASYAVKNAFFDDKIGYVDQLPFINVKRNVSYPSWLMSSDVGGIKGEVLLRFKKLFAEIRDFDYLLNAIAKIGQQNGLFCYSEPRLVKNLGVDLVFKASHRQLFSFVFQFYKSFRAVVLLWCMHRYEQKWPLGGFIIGFFKKNHFNETVDFKGIPVSSIREKISDNSIDVIIPTLGRPEHCLKVLEDLKQQSLLPKNVIVVEQNPDEGSSSQLDRIYSLDWPFQIKHIFTHKTGACRARNICLDHVSSAWVFFCDDDIRLPQDVLEKTINEAQRLSVNCFNLNCRQPGEPTIYHKIKQWASFGSGTSIVRSSFIKGLKFSVEYEHGYGEDADFGMQLRASGCDIIYHPELEIKHLKAPMGGFRAPFKKLWEAEACLPKPSPTIMLYSLKHYTKAQLLGYKNILWLKFYNVQEVKNPVRYLRSMRLRWRESQKWAVKLMSAKTSESEI